MNAENTVNTEAASPVVVAPARPSRRVGRSLVMVSVPLVMVLAGGWFWLGGGRYEETQDANLHQPRVAISANVSGLVTQVGLTDNQPVKAGDVLFQVDPAPFKLALAAVNAALAQARLNVEQMKAAYASAVTQEHVAEDQVSYLDGELTRQQALADKGVAATTAVDDARHAAVIASGQLETARQQVINALAALGGKADIATDSHPAVLAALAARDSAQFNLDQSTLRAPADGIVYQAGSFKPGQYVVAGAPVFTLVETSDVWVEADFKENQLTHVVPGQPVTVSFDLYPGRSFTGTVEAIGAGTGAEFALIPAENATGNWVKVTQRIPVRISLATPAGTPPLHSGMSADVSVDTGRIRHISDLLPAAFVNP